MKVMFLDESGDHSLVKIDAFKIRYFNDSNIVLHSREIRKCEPPFNILLNKNTKQSFYTDLNKVMADLPYTILATVILKEKLKNQYHDPANPYSLSLQFIMERFLYYLEEYNDVGYISVESRDPKSNTDLLNTFTDIINNGSASDAHRVSADRFQQKIQKMIFVTKRQNENGHQIADLVAYPIAKFGLNPRKAYPKLVLISLGIYDHDISSRS